MISVFKALKELKLSKDWVLKEEPTNKTEFENQFSVVVGVDGTNSAINSSDPKDFGVTWDEVVAKQKELQAEHDSKQYQRDREVQYPSIQEQLDMQYHDLVNGTTTWKDAIAKVKTENPKSE